PRVEELFEARKPKGLAVITEIAGKVKIQETKKKKEIVVTSKDDSKTYTIPFGTEMLVSTGDMVEAGDPLIKGSINPTEILAIKGPEGVYEYLISEVQKVYRNQGVDINDKHIEVIARQMLKKVRVDDNGDTMMFPGSLVDMYDFEDSNKEVEEQGLKPATGKRILLGITKAALATDSFLSAASFQETTRVLTDAAIKGKEDQLIGLKENVILGKLIPAGTGMQRYQNTQIEVESDGNTEAIEDNISYESKENKTEGNTIQKDNQEEDTIMNENESEALIENDSDFEELDEEE
ncbi:MAG: DNA-directed RNA polymerase subunit beta', partial [Clostridia bacterium]|nr:DNA-directed RNA polymerase subunit beta' [Clostridia bacterium]